MRRLVAAALLLLAWPSSARANGQGILAGFGGVSLDSQTGFLDLEQTVGKPKLIFGASIGRVWDMCGWEVDLSAAPGFFAGNAEPKLLFGSQVSVLTANALFFAPRRLTGSRFRPYAVTGGGLLKARIDDIYGLFPSNTWLKGIDVGGGLFVFGQNRYGLRFDARYIRSTHAPDPLGFGFSDIFVNYWRTAAGVTYRF